MTDRPDLKYRAALIDRCIEVVRISEVRFGHSSAGSFAHGKDSGARRQLAASIAALELFKAGPKKEDVK